jgi:hypothetical protein
LTFKDILGSPGRLSVGASFPGDHNPASLVSASFDDIYFTVPEPASLGMVLLGLFGIPFLRRR